MNRQRNRLLALAIAGLVLASCGDDGPPGSAATMATPGKPSAQSAAHGLALSANDARVVRQDIAGRLQGDRIVATGHAGVLAFGPYAAIAQGKYTATFEGVISSLPQGAAVRFDAVSARGTKLHGQQEVTAPLAAGPIARFDISLDEDVPDLELRVQVPEGARMELASYRLETH